MIDEETLIELATQTEIWSSVFDPTRYRVTVKECEVRWFEGTVGSRSIDGLQPTSLYLPVLALVDELSDPEDSGAFWSA